MSILIFVFTICLLVVVHELGHFCVARYFKVSIETFSVGFGKPLIKFNSSKYQTEFRLAPLLLGGYVRFSEEIPRKNNLVLFEELAIWKKILILLAGPAVNLIFAFLSLIVFFKMASYVIIPYVGDVTSNSLADHIGFKRGQRITSVNHKNVNSWEEIFELIDQKHSSISMSVNSLNELPKQIVIDNLQKHLNIKDFFSTLGMKPLLPEIPAIIGKIEEGSAAEKIKLKTGDQILSIDEQPISTMLQLSEYVRTHPNKTIIIKVKRKSDIFTLKFVIEQTQQRGQKFRRLGIYSSDYKYFPNWFHYHEESWLGALSKSILSMHSFVKMQFGVWLNLKNQLSELSGPIGIARAANEAWSIGIKTYLFFVVWLNIGLAVVNLLPIPILDGGQCLMLLLGKFFPRLLKQSHQKTIVLWSIIFLSGLFLIGLFNDCSF